MNDINEHPTADFLIWVATADHGGHKLFDPAPQSAFAFICRRRDWTYVGHQTSNGVAITDDYHTRALIIATRLAFEKLPVGARVHVITDQNWFIGILDESRPERKTRDYLRANRKSKYSYERELRELDEVAEKLCLITSSGRPETERGKKELSITKESAKQCARNINTPHSDWDLG